MFGATPDPARKNSGLPPGESRGHGCWFKGRLCGIVLRTGLAVQVSSDFPCIPREHQNLESPGDPWN